MKYNISHMHTGTGLDEISEESGLAGAPKTLLGYYAGFISRLLAFIVDAALMSILVVSTTWFVSVTTTTFRVGSFLGFSADMIPGLQSLIDVLTGPGSSAILITAFISAYHIFFWVFAGQTPGKALLGLRVVTVDGKRLSPLRAALRFAAYFISAVPLYMGFLWVIVDDRRQAWHDKITKTYVIYTWSAKPDERFLAQEIRRVSIDSEQHQRKRLARKSIQLPSSMNTPDPTNGGPAGKDY